MVDFTAVVNGTAISPHPRSSSSSAETARPPAASRHSSTANSRGLRSSRRPPRSATRRAGSSRRSPALSTGGTAGADRRASARTRATSSAKANGLGRESSAPSPRPSTRSLTVLAAVSISTRLPAPATVIRRQTSSPCTPGRSRSSTTTSYRVTARCSSASSPSRTTSTAIPSRRSPVPIDRASTSKSSATSTRMVPRMPGRRVSARCQPTAPGRHHARRKPAAMIEVTELRKRYGSPQSLDGMPFRVLPGQVTGFVGPNGAGKSTTMRIIVGLDAADAGTALIGGRPYRTLRHPLSHVGALLDAAALQPSRSARNHLLWLAYSQGLTARRVDEVIDQAGLRSAIRRKAGGYSLGMRQRLGIAAALLGDPPVLMLDEPFNGMDPEGIVWMRGFLAALAAQGRAVLVSSHLMSELQEAAGHLVIVGRGKVIADTSVADLVASASRDRVTVRTSARGDAAAVLSAAGATVADAGGGILTVSGLAAERITALLGDRKGPFSGVSAHRATLEEAYMELTRDAVEYRADPARGAA